ncbi:uncharacterized protein LOC131168225 [Malania oleifera]|uniref:uncharacterized protein LOC131168225 n=1 Tax=Malania oleifera TaxID=397392 RepID=UPI0025AEA9F3|nr:uncharacterized protein LOC131168225 [Malania oleifera]XP_057983501.1 uncharacterized protein LOC131168225 [Malania oleifera]XP_057983502.1 uncharacterized protein LOC131168225 [Malania oleifera]XP_057983503.1 uncharacterized protein LOC131168225 [Malania oleifera]
MGLFSYTLAGGGFVLIGAWEAFMCASKTLSSSPSSPSSPLNHINATPPPSSARTVKKPLSSSVSLIAVALLSFFFILNSLVSLIDAFNSSDRVGSVLQLGLISVASLFLFYAILGLLINLTDSFILPTSILTLICLFAFVEEFLLFYLQRKDPSGIENRYFDLLLVPIMVCVCSSILELKLPKSNFPRLARGVGLISQGTWFMQMGISFFTDLMVHGCSLHEKSRGNYTIRCKGHPEYHRGRAIATLQFNCHLAFLVALIVGVYSIIGRKDGGRIEFMQYRPLGAEMQQMDHQSQFTLDSDDDEIREEASVVKQKEAVIVSEVVVNGYGSHQ